MKRLVLPLFGILVSLIIVVWYMYIYPIDIGSRSFSVIIKPGDSFDTVADRFEEEGVVRWRLMLDGVARWMQLDRQLTPGRYDFSGEISTANILARLNAADFVRVKLTIIEGLPVWRTLAVIADKMELDSTEVMALQEDSSFHEELGIPWLEGHLYPETYIFPWGTSVKKVISEMVSLQRERTDSLLSLKGPNGLTRQEILILASIVEAEATREDEKPTIASVYLNRLSRNMKLDADPTVIYGLGGLDRPLSKRDLRKRTPFNTYLYRGLPPTPINSPGIESIKAVLFPDTTDYLYFVADGNGGHVFSRTHQEHLRAVRQYRRTLREGK